MLAACKEPEPQPEPQEYIYSYPTVTIPGSILNFQPVDLPAGITYTLNDENGPVTHTNGVVNANAYAIFTPITFTQTFYKDGKQIGQQVVKTLTDAANRFGALQDTDSNPVQKIPDVVLTY